MSGSTRSGVGHAFPSGRFVLVLWAVTCGLAYFGFGDYLDEFFEGTLLRDVPLLMPEVATISALAALAATAAWAARRGAAEGRRAQETHGRVARRRFLVGAAAIFGGLLAALAASLARVLDWLLVTAPVTSAEVTRTDPSPKEQWRGSRIQAYRTLGRTGFRVSDISLGSGMISEDGDGEAIAREAIERGVNYFDTSPDYAGAGSERALGRAMKGHRDRMFVATKFCTETTPHGHLRAGASVQQYMDVVHASLGRLQTDYVDLVHVHSCDRVERLQDPNLHEAFDRLRQAGKARFLGVSTHTPQLELVANTAIDSGRFDVIMLAYHFGGWPHLSQIIERAASHRLGVVAMKTLKGAKHRGLAGFRDQADAFSQAAFKWVLANPNVSCLVVSFFEHQHVDEYLYASGKPFTEPDRALLERYDRLIAGTHCFPHCGRCLTSCPEQLAIDDVLRHRMYFEDYGRRETARQLYAALEKRADVCIGCGAPCTGACPVGVSIQERTLGAHRMLSTG